MLSFKILLTGILFLFIDFLFCNLVHLFAGKNLREKSWYYVYCMLIGLIFVGSVGAIAFGGISWILILIWRI